MFLAKRHLAKCHGMRGINAGADKMKRDLKAIRGHADMAVTFRERGPDGMLTSLSTLLPALITPGASLAFSCINLHSKQRGPSHTLTQC